MIHTSSGKIKLVAAAGPIWFLRYNAA